jgi:hypothetical protein
VWLLCLAAGVAALFVRRSRRVSIGSAAPIRLWLPIALVTLAACCGCTGSHNTASQTVRSQGTAFQNAGSENFEARFPFHQQTTYFDFRLQSESPQNARTIRLSDNFVDIVKRDFFNADRGYPIRVFICQDEGKFVQFMHRDFEIQDPSDFGIYLSSKKLLATYEDSGLGTFAHEALHPLVEENLPQRPAWAFEGVPTFFEKFYGYWNGGQLVFYWGFQNPWRIKELGPELTQLDLKRIFQRMGDQSRVNPNSAWRRCFFGSKVSSGGFSDWLQLIIDSDTRRILRLPWACPWGKSRQFGRATLKA